VHDGQQAAVEWLLAHPVNSDTDALLDLGGAAGGAAAAGEEPSKEQIAMSMSRGFTPAPA